MDSRSLASRLNPRVVAALSSAPAEEEMALAGVNSEGIRIMSARAAFLVLRLDNVPFELARRVKQVMLSLGSDAAMDESSWSGVAADTPLVVMGTRRQFKELFKSLCDDETGRALCDVVALTFDSYNRRTFTLTLRSGVLSMSEGAPLIMGILNVTPDSFSDGGRYLEPSAAVARALQMAAEGAAIIDVGGESTRPGAAPVGAAEEQARVLPVISAVSRETPCPISIDTSKATVAQAALDAGASIVNDVSALGDPDMARVVARAGCPIVLMHMKGTPLTMQTSPFYRDLMGEITGYLRAAIDRAAVAGIDVEQTVVDPGIGFGKTVAHNLAIMRSLKEFRSLGRPILLGPSRKSFIGKVLDVPAPRRAFGTASAVTLAAAAGANIIRVHDVADMRHAALVAAAIATGKTGEVS